MHKTLIYNYSDKKFESKLTNSKKFYTVNNTTTNNNCYNKNM